MITILMIMIILTYLLDVLRARPFTIPKLCSIEKAGKGLRLGDSCRMTCVRECAITSHGYNHTFM